MCGNLFKPSEKAISRGDSSDRPCRRRLLRHRGRQDAGCFLYYDACANLRKHCVACGFSWLLRVTDHEAAPMDPKLFSSWLHRSLVLLKRGFGRQTSSRWRFSRKKKRLDSASSNSAASDKGHTGALYSKNSARCSALAGRCQAANLRLFVAATWRHDMALSSLTF
jgi:hypothetical protein